MRSRIFAERKINYKEAVELVLALEAAEKHAEVSGSTRAATTDSSGISGTGEAGEGRALGAAGAQAQRAARAGRAWAARRRPRPTHRRGHAGDAESLTPRTGVVLETTTVTDVANAGI